MASTLISQNRLSLLSAVAVACVLGACSYGMDEYELVDQSSSAGGMGEGGDTGTGGNSSGGEGSETGGSGGAATGGAATGGAPGGGGGSPGTGGGGNPSGPLSWHFSTDTGGWDSVGGGANQWDPDDGNEAWGSLMLDESNMTHGSCVHLIPAVAVVSVEAAFMFRVEGGNEVGVQIGLKSAEGEAWSNHATSTLDSVWVPIEPTVLNETGNFDQSQVTDVCFRVEFTGSGDFTNLSVFLDDVVVQL